LGKARAWALARAVLPASIGLLGLGVALLPAQAGAQTLDVTAWQKTLKNTPPAQPGCYQASYPTMQWQQTACTPPQNPVPSGRVPVSTDSAGEIASLPVLNGGYQAYAGSGGAIQSAEGSFIDVTGVTNIVDEVFSPYQNVYALQINSNTFIVPGGSDVCDSTGSCSVWVQFVYQNYGIANGTLGMEYWVFGSRSCASPLTSFASGVCWYPYKQTISGQVISNFNNQIKMSGQTVNGQDAVIMIIGGQAYSVLTPSVVNEFSQSWESAAFNVYGYGNGSYIDFNDGSTLTVRTKINDGGTVAPSCSFGAGGGVEGNNLNYLSTCCPYGGGEPSIAFVEGTAATPLTYPTCLTQLGSNTITPTVSSGGGAISPSVPLNVPNKTVSAFTITPSSGNTIASVSGCGGTLSSNNVYTTAPATGNCTVTAAFTSTAPTVKLTQITPRGTSSPAVGTAVSVASGGKVTYTITSPSGATSASWAGYSGGCGSFTNTPPWHVGSALTLVVGPVTSNCTFPLAFTVSNPTVKLTRITPSGTSSPAVGTAVSVALNNKITYTITPPAGVNYASWAGYSGGCGSFTPLTWKLGSALTLTVGPVTSTCTFPLAFTKR
jgi:hypothetical protein